MIPIGATVYIAPDVSNVRYLKDNIKGGFLLLGEYMMGKITRYTNGGDKIGIEFEFRVWMDGKQASNHNTGKPGYCCYVPKEYVKQIPDAEVVYFRNNIASRAVGTFDGSYNRLEFKRLTPTEKGMLIHWEHLPSVCLGTDGYPELPIASTFVSPVDCPPPPPDWKPKTATYTPSWVEQSLAYERYRDKMEQDRKAYEREYMQVPQYGLGYDPYRAGGLDKNTYGLFVGSSRRVGKTQMLKDVADVYKYYGAEISKQVIDDRIMAMSMAMQACSFVPFKFTQQPRDFELELLNL